MSTCRLLNVYGLNMVRGGMCASNGPAGARRLSWLLFTMQAFAGINMPDV